MTRVRCPGLRLFQTNLFIPTMALVDPGKCFRFNKLRFATGSHYITVMYTLPVRPQHVGFHTQRRNDLINDIGLFHALVSKNPFLPLPSYYTHSVLPWHTETSSSHRHPWFSPCFGSIKVHNIVPEIGFSSGIFDGLTI